MGNLRLMFMPVCSWPRQTETINEAARKKEAHRLLGKELVSTFGGSEIKKRVNKAMHKFGKGARHGGGVQKTKLP